MKKLLLFLIALFLPVYALAEAPVSIETDALLPLPGKNPAISDCLALSDGDALLNVLTTGDLGGTSMDMLILSESTQQVKFFDKPAIMPLPAIPTSTGTPWP